jgi:signal transduction histidine kinase
MNDGKVNQGAVSMFHELIKRDEATADFISAASHQLRTPLAVANLQVDMLLAGYLGNLNEGQREVVQEISFYNQKMAAVMAEFLTASRIELGTFSVARKPTDLIDRVEAALRELSGDIKHKHIDIIRQFEPDLPVVIIDPEVMRMVFHHLISNALKYTESGGTITISFKKVKNKIIASIEDTGKGIAKENLPMIFERLYGRINVDGEKSSKVGFGLYFIKTLLDLCNCEITVTSKVGEGSKFALKIPLF